MPHISDNLMATAPRSLWFGVRTTRTEVGAETGVVSLEGTPDGLRMLARFLSEMADAVESGEAPSGGWGLTLSPADIPALSSDEDVRLLSVTCLTTGRFRPRADR